MLTALAGCTSLGFISANNEATQAATDQTTQQVVVWQFVGWDFEFNKTDLSNAIANGTHRLGKMINNTHYVGGRTGGGIASVSGGNNFTPGTPGRVELIDPSKPATYYPVYVKTIENRR
jgi:hypothetical protein